MDEIEKWSSGVQDALKAGGEQQSYAHSITDSSAEDVVHYTQECERAVVTNHSNDAAISNLRASRDLEEIMVKRAEERYARNLCLFRRVHSLLTLDDFQRLQSRPSDPYRLSNYRAVSSRVGSDQNKASSYHDKTSLEHDKTEDDMEMRKIPSRQVDYLSHDWEAEDLWSSWRYVVSKRRTYGETSRLENALWRSWAQIDHKVGLCLPDSINW